MIVKILIKKSGTVYFVSILTLLVVSGMSESVVLSLIGTNPQRAYQHLFWAIFVPSSVLGANSALPPTLTVKHPARIRVIAARRIRLVSFLLFIVLPSFWGMYPSGLPFLAFLW